MFGALNRFISRLDADPQSQDATSTASSILQRASGFQVLRNSNDDLPVDPWFDFVIGINGRNIDNSDPNLFAAEIRNCAGASVGLGLWSAKGQRIRSIYASVPKDNPTLGLSLQWTPIQSTEDVWHILEVSPNSPADAAGLLAYGDYIIGSPEGLLKGESGLGELVEDYLGRPLRLFVHNHDYNITRLVTIEPSRTWGGTGALGCILGYGALHRIPAPLDEPPQAPGETMFEAARLSTEGEPGPPEPTIPQQAQYLVPAELSNPTPPPGPPTSTGPPPQAARRHRPQHHVAKTDMDAYFAEGEEKSRREEGGNETPKPPKPGVAPPPKAAPPRTDTPSEKATDTT